jgi:Holliday junction resolvase RusA-like endonuclease
VITFTVPGEPVPQPRQRFTVVAGFPKPYKDEKHPVHAFRQAVALSATIAGLKKRSEPMNVCIVAVFRRPASHVTAKGIVKATAPRVPRPDVDNLAKAVLDALGDFFDDTLVESLQVSKSYGDVAHTKVVIA